jgi:hypothetical protein
MSQRVNFPLLSGGGIVVEVDEHDQGPRLAAKPGEFAAQSALSFEQAVSRIGPVAQAVLEQVVSLSPQEVEVEFGIKFSAEAGIIVARAATEGNCKISMRWKKG